MKIHHLVGSYRKPRTTRIPPWRSIAVILWVCLLAACAAQGPPTPPRVEKPERITDLTLAQIGRTLEISFTPATLATDGERLSKPQEIQIFRSITAGGQQPVPISTPQGAWITLPENQWLALRSRPVASEPGLRASEPGGQSESAAGATTKQTRTRTGESKKNTGRPAALKPKKTPKRKGKQPHNTNQGNPKIVYRYDLSEQEFKQMLGSTLAFAARGVTRGFAGRPVEGELSNTATASLLDVSPPVEGVMAAPAEHAVELHWSPPVTTLTGAAPSGPASYHVYKSAAGEQGPFQLLAETVEPHYQDPGFQFGHTYSYRVRAVFKQDGRAAESADSLPAVITPRDTFPPAAPSGLTGIYTASVVELIWNANTESDLAGYNVYRREGSAAPQRVNPDLVSTPIFRDASVEPGHTYIYWVTAVDLANNESGPPEAVRVETR